jgi:hypothetical protein
MNMCSCVLGWSLCLAMTTGIAAEKKWTLPRTAHGHPDLQGVWTNATITPPERPDQFGERRALTEAESDALEQRQASAVERGAQRSDLNKELPPAADGVGGYNNFWIDRGSKVAEVDGEKRSSLLIDPPDGKYPRPKQGRRALDNTRARAGRFDGPEVRPLGERCLLAFGSSSGPPMMPVLYNNHYQIVQNKDTVLILVEMVHDARIVRLNGQHLGAHIPKWMGDSVGRWDGDTLVVETSNFTDKDSLRGTPQRKVVERFTRVAADKLHYSATVEDPATYDQSWTLQFPFYRTDDTIYEYACHEGNYALPGILAGARAEEKNGTEARP